MSNTEKSTKSLSIRFPTHILAQMKEIAKRHNRSLSGEVLTALEEHIKRNQKWMQTVRIYQLEHLSPTLFRRLKTAQMEAEVPQAEQAPGDVQATVDLGEIHLAAVTTNIGKAMIVTGRGIRSLKRQRTMRVRQITKKQSRCQKYSRRWKKLQHAKNKVSKRSERRIRDLRHKATRQVIDFCVEKEVGTLFIGNPHGVRHRDNGRHHNQRMALWEYGKDIDYLTHKAKQAHISCFTGSERGTSSQCPCCGHKQKPKGRIWACRACGFTGHRDLVGSVNMHPLAFREHVTFPHSVTYLRPSLSRRSSRADTPQRGLSESADQALLGEQVSSETAYPADVA